jgi:hypothetical protein
MLGLAKLLIIGACAASGSDAITTMIGHNQRELNPILRARDGHPNLPPMIALDVGGCLGAIALRKRKGSKVASSTLLAEHLIITIGNIRALADGGGTGH